jgi:mycofactocin precursor
MVTLPAPPYTVTSIRQGRPDRHPIPPRPTQEALMQQDTRADAWPAGAPSRPSGAGHDLGVGQEPGIGDPGITEELLVEEVSIDGMCGVY